VAEGASNGVPPTPLRSAPDAATAEGWAFVLDALGIPSRIERREADFALHVSPVDALRAAAALAAHDRELLEGAEARVPPPPDLGPSGAGVAVTALLAAFYVVTGARDGGDPGGWFRRGAAIAEKIVGGEPWRAVTALTLHADPAHVAGNAVAALIFLSALGRWLGTGLAVALTLASGALGNLIVAFAYRQGHNSVGASTATFGALGVLGGLQVVRWLRGRRAPGGRRRVLSIIAACLGLFAMLGVGARSDVLAHVAGLGVGLVLGAITGALLARPLPRPARIAAGALASVVVAGAWMLARAHSA
jgi:membrane associated rhomboid family serine protease